MICPKGVRGNPDVSAVASLDKNQLAVLSWHYHDDDVSGPDAAIDLNLSGIPLANGNVQVTHYRIDADHSNAYAAWLRMGMPLPLSEKQFAELERDGQLAQLTSAGKTSVSDGKAEMKFNLPRQGVSLLVFTWK